VTAVDVSSEVMEARRRRDNGPSAAATLRQGAARLMAALGPRLGDRQQFAAQFVSRWLEDDGADPRPTLVEAVLDAMSIAQRSIKAARLRQDPPEHTVTPEVGDLRFLDFHRGGEAIRAGEAAAAEFLRLVRG
jgi:NTE family protein